MRIQNIIDALTNRWVIYTLISWLVIVIIFAFVLSYTAQNERLKDQKIELTSDIETLLAKKNELEANKGQLSLLTDKKLSMILADLLTASKESGVLLGETQLAEIVAHDNYRGLPMMMSIKGNYNQIGKFVNLLEKDLQYQILDINLSTKDTRGYGIISKLRAEFIVL